MPSPSSSNDDERPPEWEGGLQPMYGQRLPGQPLTPPRKPLEKPAGSWAAKWAGAPKLKPYNEENDDSDHQNERAPASAQPKGGPPGLGVAPYPASPPGLGAPQQTTSKDELGWARTPEPRRVSVAVEKDGAPIRAARQLPQPPSKAVLPQAPSKAMPQSSKAMPQKVPDVRPAKNMGFLFMQAEEEARQVKLDSVAPSAAHDEEWEFLDEEPSAEQINALGKRKASRSPRRKTSSPQGHGEVVAADSGDYRYSPKADNTPKLVLCPLGCGCEGPADALELHVAKYCPNRPAEAPAEAPAQGKSFSKAAPRPPGPPPFPVKAPPTMTPPAMTPPAMTPPAMAPPTVPFPGSSEAPSPEASAPPSLAPVLSLPPLPVFPGMPAPPLLVGTSGKAASAAGQKLQQPSPDSMQPKMPSPVPQMPPPMQQSQPQIGFQMPGGLDQLANGGAQQLTKQSQLIGTTAPQSQQLGGASSSSGPPTMVPPAIPPALAAMLPAGVNPKAMLPPLPVFPSAAVSGSPASQQSSAPPLIPPALAAMLAGHSAQSVQMRPPAVENPAPVPPAQVTTAPVPPTQVTPAPAPVAPTPTQSAAPPSGNPLLTIIRLGIANEDRAGVRAAVDAATKAGVKLEPNIQNMLKQWLGEMPLQKQSQSTPEVKTPLEPNSSSTTPESKPPEVSEAQAKQFGSLPPHSMHREYAGAQAKQSGVLPPQNMPPELARQFAALAGVQAKQGGLPPQSMAPESAIPYAALAGVQAKQGGLPPQSMHLPAPTFPPMPVFPPMPPAVGLSTPVTSIPMGNPSAVLPIPTLESTAPALSSSAALTHNEVSSPSNIVSSETPTVGETPSTQPNASIEATAPAQSAAKALAKVLPPAPPGAGVSIFKKPVLKGKDVDIDKAMDDFFSEIGGDLLEASDETALAEENPPEPKAAQESKWTCPGCDETNKASRAKCNNCGHKRPEAVEVPSAPEVPGTSAPPKGEDVEQIVANDGNFMARFLAMQSGTSKEQAPSLEKPPEPSKDDAPAPPSDTGEDSLKRLKRSREEVVRKIQEERKAARRREASPPPPPREKSPPPPPVAVEPPRPPPDKNYKAWPGQKDDDDKFEKKADKQPEAWEYMKKDVWGQGNFFSFDNF